MSAPRTVWAYFEQEAGPASIAARPGAARKASAGDRARTRTLGARGARCGCPSFRLDRDLAAAAGPLGQREVRTVRGRLESGRVSTDRRVPWRSGGTRGAFRAATRTLAAGSGVAKE